LGEREEGKDPISVKKVFIGKINKSAKKLKWIIRGTVFRG
jgi:hypothetical protein